MKQISPKTSITDISTPGKQRSYNEIVELLEANWRPSEDNHLITKLDQALGKPSKKIDTILVAGTNGKSLTMHFATKLLGQEGISVGSFYTPHILTYNERFALNGATISNKDFTDIANEVLNIAAAEQLKPNTFEILTAMALIFFAANNVDVALLEGPEQEIKTIKICQPKIVALTRYVPDNTKKSIKEISEALKGADTDTWVVSADQSKANLQEMAMQAKKKGAQWAMPIRKVAPLAYPFEQIHGRCAALAERIASLYINKMATKDAVIVSGSLLTKPKVRRGRPTLEAKRQSELNPPKTLEQFWKEQYGNLPGRFQILDKEKPTIILDTADNVDAIKNLLLGVRLLHYQRPLQGLTLILGGNNQAIEIEALLKELRYFFKKTSGQVIVCPVNQEPGLSETRSWNVEKLTNDLKSMKIKATGAKSLKEAFDNASNTVDDKHGLIVVTGSVAIVKKYWHNYKGMKKL